MFKALLGDLELSGDHIDLSYRDPQSWPALLPSGGIRSFVFDIGDPEAGPSLQLGLISPVEGEVLDWKHSIDPVHHHGSDQFRVCLGGSWILANRTMPVGALSFQEAGWVYQEHPTAGAPASIALLMADRRGTMSTLHFDRDKETIFAAGAEFGQPPEEEVPYPHPAGDKGIAAIATNRGGCQRGYLHVEPEELTDGDVVTGLLGDPVAGPVVHAFRSAPDALVVPSCRFATEVVLIVAAGGCRIGDADYRAGDLRIQRADAPFSVKAGSNGVELVLIVGDRRAVGMVLDGSKPDWMTQASSLIAALDPVPGGTWRKAA